MGFKFPSLAVSFHRLATGSAEFGRSALSQLLMAASLTCWTSIFANSSISGLGIYLVFPPGYSSWPAYSSRFQRVDGPYDCGGKGPQPRGLGQGCCGHWGG